ncbi:MAG: hypothetical protein REI45_03420 [Propionicimonas sp.]|nr:hypothetical protein [Propionicimonas sp.]
MRSGGAARTVSTHRDRTHGRLRGAGRSVLVAALAVALALVAPAVPAAVAEPALPAAPSATTTPTASPTPTATPASPSPSGSPTPRPDPEGDRWVQLAVVGGGSLLGAVVMFMVIGGIIRAVNRRRYRR